MNTDLFRKSTARNLDCGNIFERFGLTQNPFPDKPSVTIAAPDPKQNGSIYLESLRESEQLKFDQLLIPNLERPQARSIAFLMDYATRRGRGIGKTAFLYHQQKRIMMDFGNKMSQGSHVLFAVYTLPKPNGAVRKFGQFCEMLLEEMSSDDNPIVSMAIWRLRAFSDFVSDDILESVGNKPDQTIGNNEWLQGREVDVFWSLNRELRTLLTGADINETLVDTLVNHGHSPHEFRRNYLDKLSSTAWRTDGAQIIFDDLVKLFKLAGFDKGIFLIDGGGSF
ncbi:hypothetical protein KFU94_22415 [Chloroflexi bacterium TSY]|nr:hypothetical protein [Chloroflexi bacterium TSY]